MYDMINDPSEMNNIYDSPEYADKKVELIQLLKETREGYNDDSL